MKITAKQYEGLKRVAGGKSWTEGKHRAGGAVARMFNRLEVLGLFDWGVYGPVVTPRGKRVIKAYEARQRRGKSCK